MFYAKWKTIVSNLQTITAHLAVIYGRFETSVRLACDSKRHEILLRIRYWFTSNHIPFRFGWPREASRLEAKTHEAEAKTHEAEAEATTHEAEAEARFFGLEAEARPRGLTSLAVGQIIWSRKLSWVIRTNVTSMILIEVCQAVIYVHLTLDLRKRNDRISNKKFNIISLLKINNGKTTGCNNWIISFEMFNR